MKTVRTSRKDGQSGTVLTETAVILPLFLLLVIGMMELGIVLNSYITLQNATREGARFAAVGNSEAAVQQRVRDFAFRLDDEDLAVVVLNAQGTRGSSVTVRATYPVPIITPLIQQLTGGSTFELQAESLMRLE